MIRHCVIFTLQLPGSAEEQQAHLKKIENLLENLPEQILELESMEVFFNCNPNEESTFMLQADVEDLEALSAYATHPAHVQIVNDLIKPYKVGRTCIDYKLHDHYPH